MFLFCLCNSPFCCPYSSYPHHPVLLSSTSNYYHLTKEKKSKAIKVTAQSHINAILGKDARCIVFALQVALWEPFDFSNNSCRVGSRCRLRCFMGSPREGTSALTRPVVSAVQPTYIYMLSTNRSHLSNAVKEPLSYNLVLFPLWSEPYSWRIKEKSHPSLTPQIIALAGIQC